MKKEKIVRHEQMPKPEIQIRPNGSKRIQLFNSEPSRTQQQFKERVNVNNIMAKYKKTGLIEHVAAIQGQYGDFSRARDFHSAQQALVDASNRFNGLPAELRDYFGNDPGKLLDFVGDVNNRDKAIELGLIPKPPEKAPEPPKTDPPKADAKT